MCADYGMTGALRKLDIRTLPKRAIFWEVGGRDRNGLKKQLLGIGTNVTRFKQLNSYPDLQNKFGPNLESLCCSYSVWSSVVLCLCLVMFLICVCVFISKLFLLCLDWESYLRIVDFTPAKASHLYLDWVALLFVYCVFILSFVFSVCVTRSSG